MRIKSMICLTALTVVGGGCEMEHDSVEHTSVTVGVTVNDLFLDNGRKLNGRKLNGRKLNGRKLNGRKLNTGGLEGASYSGARVDGTILSLVEQVDGTTASLDACASTTYGPFRSCGFESAGIGTCTPSTPVTVGAGCGLGEAEGDTMLRICAGDVPCEHTDPTRIAYNDDVYGCGYTSATTFTCPAGGVYNVMVGMYNSGYEVTAVAEASAGTFPLATAGDNLVGIEIYGETQSWERNDAPQAVTMRVDSFIDGIEDATGQLAACSSAGAARNCGWNADYIGTCDPGSMVQVGANAACDLGSADYYPVVRVCRGDDTCASGSAGSLGQAYGTSTTCGVYGGVVDFVCPSEAHFTVMTGNYYPWVTIPVRPDVRLDPDAPACDDAAPPTLKQLDPAIALYQLTFATHGIADHSVMNACGGSRSGGDTRSESTTRDASLTCGWTAVGKGSCRTGEYVVLGPRGRPTSADPVVRVCAGAAGCDASSSIAGDSALLGFYCPSGGVYSVLAAPYADGSPAIDPTVVASAGNFPVYDWESLCDGHGFVTAVDGVWNERNGDRLDPPGGFTLACMTGAIGKCLDIYHAWESDDLRDTHQACTRMVRADYCGNGTAYTHDGTPIDVEDELGIETLDSTPFELEAHWTPDGAHCVGSGRYNYFILPAYPTEEESTPSPIDSCPDRFTACENLPASVAPGSAGDPSLLTSHADPEKWPWSSTPQYSIDWCE